MGRERVDVDRCERINLVSYPRVRWRGNGWNLERQPAGAIVNRVPQVVSALEAVRLLENWIAEVLEIARRFHHLDQRALDPPRQHFVINLLSTKWAAPRFDRLRFKQPFRLPY